MKIHRKVFSYTTQGYFDKKCPVDVVTEELNNTLAAESIVSILEENNEDLNMDKKAVKGVLFTILKLTIVWAMAWCVFILLNWNALF